MVDQFLFSLPALGVKDIVLLMKVQYEEINSVKLPTVRKMHAPDSTGTYSKEPVLIQLSENVKFNNGFKAEGFASK